jgi:rhamnose utilization protein RhaD (predicted bifunctional aldolase and dehydrogenase)
MWVEKCDPIETNTITLKLKALVKGGQKPAAAFIVKGLGIFVAADKKTAPIIAEITEGSLQIRMWATKFGGILALTRRQQDFINNWEAEAFRKKLAGGQT